MTAVDEPWLQSRPEGDPVMYPGQGGGGERGKVYMLEGATVKGIVTVSSITNTVHAHVNTRV